VQPAENNPCAAASRAAGAANSTRKHELKLGAVMECACDAEDGLKTIEWHPGSAAIDYLQSVFLRICTAHDTTRDPLHHTPTHAAHVCTAV